MVEAAGIESKKRFSCQFAKRDSTRINIGDFACLTQLHESTKMNQGAFFLLEMLEIFRAKFSCAAQTY
jgi:hypothetical protein